MAPRPAVRRGVGTLPLDDGRRSGTSVLKSPYHPTQPSARERAQQRGSPSDDPRCANERLAREPEGCGGRGRRPTPGVGCVDGPVLNAAPSRAHLPSPGYRQRLGGSGFRPEADGPRRAPPQTPGPLPLRLPGSVFACVPFLVVVPCRRRPELSLRPYCHGVRAVKVRPGSAAYLASIRSALPEFLFLLAQVASP